MYYMAYLNIKRYSVSPQKAQRMFRGNACGYHWRRARHRAWNGADVCVIDIRSNPYFTGDIADEDTLKRFSEKVIGGYGHVDFLMNNAMPL